MDASTGPKNVQKQDARRYGLHPEQEEFPLAPAWPNKVEDASRQPSPPAPPCFGLRLGFGPSTLGCNVLSSCALRRSF